METKHTPGPWKAVNRGADCNFVHNITVGGKAIANVIDYGCASQVNQYVAPNLEQEANALLIAAAPDLLAAANNALDMTPTDCEGNDDCWRCVLRAAIAKATT